MTYIGRKDEMAEEALMIEPDSLEKFSTEQRKAFSAIIALFLILEKQRYQSHSGDRMLLQVPEISAVTQASAIEVRDALGLLDRAGMLHVCEDQHGKKYSYFSGRLAKDVMSEGWTGSCSTLAIAYDGNGATKYTGCIGHNNWLDREGYTDTKAGYEDSQHSKITEKGRAAYVVANLIVPRDLSIQLVA
jgi:hypothetical protein